MWPPGVLAAATATWQAEGSYGVSAATDSFSGELSTNLRLVVLTLFLGGGVDYVGGGATSLATLGGPITVAGSGGSEQLGTASLALDYAGSPDRVVFRAFAGPQLNLWMVKLYAQVNLASNAGLGAHTGLRFAW